MLFIYILKMQNKFFSSLPLWVPVNLYLFSDTMPFDIMGSFMQVKSDNWYIGDPTILRQLYRRDKSGLKKTKCKRIEKIKE